MTVPIDLLKDWLEEEKKAGALEASHAILSTKGTTGEPQGRVVAIRKITEEGILFFTQKRTRKVHGIRNCSQVALTFWFERYAREVMIEGEASFLSASQNAEYWSSYSKEGKVRFCSYAPTSGLPIDDKQVLEDKRLEKSQTFKDSAIPLSEEYCGIVVQPKRFVFYTYRLDELSDVWEYQQNNARGSFIISRLLP